MLYAELQKLAREVPETRKHIVPLLQRFQKEAVTLSKYPPGIKGVQAAMAQAIKKGKPLCYPIVEVFPPDAPNFSITGNVLRVGVWLEEKDAQYRQSHKVGLGWHLTGFTTDRNEARSKATEV